MSDNDSNEPQAAPAEASDATTTSGQDGNNGASDGQPSPEQSAEVQSDGAQSAADGGDGAKADGAKADDGSDEAAGSEAAKPDLAAELESARADVKRLKEKVLRVAADFDNFRKRSNREIEDARRRGKQSSVKDLLPVFDNLERAVVLSDENTDAKSMADGIRMVLKQFADTLGRVGIKRVEAVGQPFDPMIHDSIQHETSTDIAAGLIINQVQPGYMMGKDLLRPAMVIVSKGPMLEEKADPTDGDAPAANDDSDDPAAAADGSDDAAVPADGSASGDAEAADAGAVDEGAEATTGDKAGESTDDEG